MSDGIVYIQSSSIYFTKVLRSSVFIIIQFPLFLRYGINKHQHIPIRLLVGITSGLRPKKNHAYALSLDLLCSLANCLYYLIHATNIRIIN